MAQRVLVSALRTGLPRAQSLVGARATRACAQAARSVAVVAKPHVRALHASPALLNAAGDSDDGAQPQEDEELLGGVGGADSGLFGDSDDDAFDAGRADAAPAQAAAMDTDEWLEQAEGLDEEDRAAFRRGEMPANMLMKMNMREWEKVWPGDGPELPQPSTLPPWDHTPDTVPEEDLPTKDEYVRSHFILEEEGFELPDMSEAPDLSSMTPDERDAYDAAMAQKHAAKLEREMRESWRLDQMRGRKEPLWMRYENEVSSDEETTVAVDELSKAIDIKSVIRWPMRDSKGRAYATGKRKTAVARVWIKKGTGSFVVNKQPLAEYFDRSSLRAMCLFPFVLTQTCGAFDVWLTVKGGGLAGQAGAIKHGLSKALARYDPFFRPILKSEKLLKRDPRMVERKKPGQKKARKKFQWVKR